MLYVESPVQLKRHNGSAEYFLFAVKRKEVLKIQDGSHGFHGRGVAATSDRRAYAGVCAFFVLGVACTNRCLEHQYMCRHVHYTPFSSSFAGTMEYSCGRSRGCMTLRIQGHSGT